MLKGGLVLIWELDMNLEPTLLCIFGKASLKDILKLKGLTEL